MKKYHLQILMAVVLVQIFTSCVTKEERFYFGDYSQAEQLFQKNEYEKALQKYQAYIDQNPEGNLAVIASFYMAKCHVELGHTEEAKKIFQDIIQNHSQLVWANFSETQLQKLNSSAPATSSSK